jgi:hypothetical protein
MSSTQHTTLALSEGIIDVDIIDLTLDDETFESLLLKQRREKIRMNIENIMKDAMKVPLANYIKTKIDRECILKGFNRRDILYKIQTDRHFASFFIKEPMKQNIGENLQLELLRRRYPDAIKLPASGPDAFYISTIGIVSNTKSSKSFDFFHTSSDDKKVFYVCKYTHEEGGSQDNQCIEVKQYIHSINNCTDDTIHFILLLDGDYWKKRWEGLNILNQNKNCTIAISNV